MQWLVGKPHLPSFQQAKLAASSFAPTAPPAFWNSHCNSRPPQDKEHCCTLSTIKGPLLLFLYWGGGGEQKSAGVMYKGSRDIPPAR